MPAAIVTLVSMKGGSGKSTLASCLAVHWHLAGAQTAIIDADPQRSVARLAIRERRLGGVTVIEDASEGAAGTAKRIASGGKLVIVDTPGFRSETTLTCLAIADFVLVPVKPSPFDVDRMIDTLDVIAGSPSGQRATFRCVLTQTTRDSLIAKHIRSELSEGGFPLLRSEMINRVVYAEAALWGATPNLIDPNGPAAHDIAGVAAEVDAVLAFKRAA